MKKFLLTLNIFLLLQGISYSQDIPSPQIEKRIYTTAKITKIQVAKSKTPDGISITETHIHLQVLKGKFKGETHIARFGGTTDLPDDMQYKKGDHLFIGISETYEPGTPGYISLYDFDNSPIIIVLVILFIFTILLVGRFKGIASLIALIVTILLLFLILIPLTLKGYPPLPIAVAISIFSIIITLPIIAGFKLKTAAAIIGASIGILFSFILTIIFGWLLHLSGIVTNEMLTIFFASDVKIDLKGLALASMIIASLGAIMDISISIASSTAEIYSANPELTEKEAFKSVLNIGTDILGSMVNTLILAFVGSSLSMILWISMRYDPEMSFWMILNYNPVLNEIVKSIIGSLGMFMAIPATAYISVRFYKKYS